MSTNFVKQKFQWFFDMNTNATSCQVITVKAGGKNVLKRTAPFFAAFKYCKLGSVKVRFVPAATLPVDPTGLSYEAGESTVDPRDQFNPGLVRITNGEDFAPEDIVEGNVAMNNYYNMMVDPRWYKFSLQSGFKRQAIPLFWNIAQAHQDAWPGRVVNDAGINIESMDPLDVKYKPGYSINQVVGYDTPSAGQQGHVGESSPLGIFQTGHKVRMGWMPTDMMQAFFKYGDDDFIIGGVNAIPEIELLKIVLPKAYKTKYYYRVYVEETIMFKDPVSIAGYEDPDTGAGYYGFDRFVAAHVGMADPTIGFANNIKSASGNDGSGDL